MLKLSFLLFLVFKFIFYTVVEYLYLPLSILYYKANIYYAFLFSLNSLSDERNERMLLVHPDEFKQDKNITIKSRNNQACVFAKGYLLNTACFGWFYYILFGQIYR